MTPAEELRVAAEKLRTLSTEASEPPWTVNQWGNVESADFAEAAEVWPLQAKPGANADYIAAMHPGVGAALADWLDAYAEHLAATTHPGWQETTAPVQLAVARQILGSQP
ncbi:hypothetical protein ACFWNQ_24960 [Streptomyces virginiae]|uniref:hypothetical protein n=1 Tax=Streptomyces virginiae TaxID=1961 RepID=UPI003658DF82